ncbi:complement regulator-acquiring protein [Borreliella lusitaniae]|uniref:complement regulator-acquiring protein n=1 Tax=Borreliella lusitaniae TaxID=100177 RepID=UPI00292E756C|nr:complement regulator-acquiring protein [Borreliella lusitaniae]WNY67335.1 complement regulator-acquiring protein [Borreliella lusitaniae]
MNKTKLSIFITLGIITLFSCKLNYEEGKTKVASFKEISQDQSNSQKEMENEEHQRPTKNFKILSKNKEHLIDKLFEILAREMSIIKKEKLQTEIPSQFGLKNSMFELINVYKTNSKNGEKLKEKMNSSLIESQKMRRQFYSSLSYNTTDIFNLAEIVNKLYQTPKTQDTIKKISGGIRIQQAFEVALEDLAINMDNLRADTFSQSTLEEIYNVIESLIEIKKEWLSTIETLIQSSNSTLELQNNKEKLKEHINELYQDKIISLCLSAEQALINLDTLFNNNNN